MDDFLAHGGRDDDPVLDGVSRLAELAARSERAPPLDRAAVMRRIAAARDARRFPFALAAGIGAAVVVSLPSWHELTDPLAALKSLPGLAALLQIG